MARVNSLVWVSVLGTMLSLVSVASCTDDTLDDEVGGAGGEDAEAGAPSNGGTAGSSGGSSGSSGEGGALEGGASGSGGTPSAEGGASGASGAGGAGGAVGNVCDDPASGETSAEGTTCAEYCAAFYATCSDYADDALFTSEADCRDTCENFSDEQLCCRAFQVLEASTATGAAVGTACSGAAGDGELCN